jgi:hypothetical protein
MLEQPIRSLELAGIVLGQPQRTDESMVRAEVRGDNASQAARLPAAFERVRPTLQGPHIVSNMYQILSCCTLP